MSEKTIAAKLRGNVTKKKNQLANIIIFVNKNSQIKGVMKLIIVLCIALNIPLHHIVRTEGHRK